MSPTSTSPKSHPLSHVDEYLAVGQRGGASDIHLGVNAPPIWRLHGTLQPIWPDAPRLTSDQTRALAEGFLSNPQKTQLNERGAPAARGGSRLPNHQHKSAHDGRARFAGASQTSDALSKRTDSRHRLG